MQLNAATMHKQYPTYPEPHTAAPDNANVTAAVMPTANSTNSTNSTYTTNTTTTNTTATNTTMVDLKKMLDALTPAQQQHMLDLLLNGTAAPSVAPSVAPSNTTGISSHVRSRHYDPVGTGRLENTTTIANSTNVGSKTAVGLAASSVLIDRDSILNATMIASMIGATVDNSTKMVVVTCADVGLPCNCTSEDVLDELDRREDEYDAMLAGALAPMSVVAQSGPSGAPMAAAPFSRAPAPAPGPATTATALLAASVNSTTIPDGATSSGTNNTVYIYDSGSDSNNAMMIAVLVLVSVVIAGIGLFVLHKRRARGRVQQLQDDFSQGGDFDWRDDKGLELSKSGRGLFDDVDEEYQSLSNNNVRKGGSGGGLKPIRTSKMH